MSERAHLQTRAAEGGDLEELLEICRRRRYPKTVFIEPDQMRDTALDFFEAYFEDLGANPNLLLEVLTENDKVVGYVVVEPRQKESITHQNQTQIGDCYAKRWEHFKMLADRACEIARAAGDEFVVGWNFVDSTETEDWLRRYGFHEELKRAVLPVAKGFRGAEHPEFPVRPATDNDMMFIMRLAANNSPLYCPAKREVDYSKIQMGFVRAYSGLGPRNKKRAPLVMYHRSTGELMGYLIVEPSKVLGRGRKLTLYGYDVAVAPEAPKIGLSRYLCGAAQTLMGGMGGGIFFGDATADNILALNAQRALGFVIDSVRWGYHLENP